MRKDIEIRRLKRRINSLEREKRKQKKTIQDIQNTYNRKIEDFDESIKNLEVNNFMLTSEVNGLRVRENSRSKDKVTAVLLAGVGFLISLIVLAKRK